MNFIHIKKNNNRFSFKIKFNFKVQYINFLNKNSAVYLSIDLAMQK